MTPLMVVMVVVTVVLQVVMLLEEVVKLEHNREAVARDQFQIVELLDLHFKEDLVLVAAVVDTSAVVAEVDIMVVVLMVQEAVDQVILDHRF